MSQIPSNTVSESRGGSTIAGNYFQQRTTREAELFNNLDAARSKELVFNGQLGSAGCLKQEYQSPQSLFSDWHWKKDLGSSTIEYRPNKDFNGNPDVNADSNGSLWALQGVFLSYKVAAFGITTWSPPPQTSLNQWKYKSYSSDSGFQIPEGIMVYFSCFSVLFLLIYLKELCYLYT